MRYRKPIFGMEEKYRGIRLCKIFNQTCRYFNFKVLYNTHQFMPSLSIRYAGCIHEAQTLRRFKISSLLRLKRRGQGSIVHEIWSDYSCEHGLTIRGLFHLDTQSTWIGKRGEKILKLPPSVFGLLRQCRTKFCF